MLMVAAMVAVAGAQAPNRETTPGFWSDWKWEISSGDVAQIGATPAEMKTLVAKLLELREVLKAAPAVASPVGFSAYLQGHFNGFDVPYRPDLKGRDYPLSARLWFGAFTLEFDQTGTLRHTVGETELLPIEVNRLPVGLESPDWRDAETDVVLQPKPLADIAGLPRFGDVLTLKTNPKPVWSPVTTEAALTLMKKQRKKEVASFEDGARRIRQSYDEWMDPAKRAARERQQKARAQTAKDPEAALAYEQKRSMETEDALRKQLETDGDPVANTFWAAGVAKVKDVDEALASLSAERKAAPACYVPSKGGRTPDERALSRIVQADTPGCQPVVQRNWSYFDRALPRSAFQIVTIGMIGRGADDQAATKSTRRWGCPVNLEFLKSVDWERVKALMDK